MRGHTFLITLLGAGCLLAADKPKQPEPTQTIEVTKTQTFDFPANGLLRLKHSTGDLTIEAWDQPNVEITTVKTTLNEYPERERATATAELEKVTVTAERHGDELVVTTGYPRHRKFPFSAAIKDAAIKLSPIPAVAFRLEYHISVPRSARLAIDHNIGAVNVDGVTGDIEATLVQGEIMLHLPEDAQYNIDAKSNYGNVNSDFPGEERRRWISQKAWNGAQPPAHNLKLRVGYGDIVLLRIRLPEVPGPTQIAPAGGGL